MGKEQWRWVGGFVGCYAVSSLGRVRSVERFANHSRAGVRRVPPRYMKPQPHPDGALQVVLWRNGSPRCFKVARLVAEAFLGVPKGKDVTWKNGNRLDNRLTNLTLRQHGRPHGQG